VKSPRRRFLGLSWLGWLNFLLLQWFFLRAFVQIAKTDPNEGSEVNAFGLLWAWPLTRWSFLPWSRVPRRVPEGTSRVLYAWRKK